MKIICFFLVSTILSVATAAEQINLNENGRLTIRIDSLEPGNYVERFIIGEPIFGILLEQNVVTHTLNDDDSKYFYFDPMIILAPSAPNLISGQQIELTASQIKNILMSYTESGTEASCLFSHVRFFAERLLTRDFLGRKLIMPSFCYYPKTDTLVGSTANGLLDPVIPNREPVVIQDTGSSARATITFILE